MFNCDFRYEQRGIPLIFQVPVLSKSLVVKSPPDGDHFIELMERIFNLHLTAKFRFHHIDNP